MAKRKRENYEKVNEKKRKEGRGQGHFESYKPWINIQDVASKGLASRIKGIKTGRSHQILSNLELAYLYLLDWSDEVVDIREQYPLDLPETLALSKEVGIIHPPRSNPHNPLVITTDFLITIRQSIGTKEVARTIKYSKDLTNTRVLEKFEIERLYWKERQIDWGIVTELDIDEVLIKNTKWLYRFCRKESLPFQLKDSQITKISNYMLPFVQKRQKALRDITSECDEEFDLIPGNSLALARHLIATKSWIVNILKPIRPEQILDLISTNYKEDNYESV